MTLTPEGAALIEHRKASAAELGLPVDDPLVIQHGALRAAHDLCQVKIAEGELSAVPDLIRLHDAMVQIKSLVPPKPVEVNLVIAHKTIGGCPHCHTPIYEDDLKPLPPVEPVRAAQSETPPQKERTTDGDKPVAEPFTALANVVALQPPRRDPGSIHNAVLPDGTPARMAPSVTRQVAPYVGGVSAPFGRGVLSEPAPNWSAAHALPPIPRE